MNSRFVSIEDAENRTPEEMSILLSDFAVVENEPEPK